MTQQTNVNENGQYKDYLIDDYNSFCRDGGMKCHFCDSYSARYVECQIEDLKNASSTIKFILSCDACGEWIEWPLRYQDIEHLAFRYLYKPGIQNDSLSMLFRMYRLLYQYPHLMHSNQDKANYKKWFERIEKSLADKDKIKKAKRYQEKWSK